MTERWWELLVCPNCGGGLSWASGQASCEKCRRDFPLQDGIPALFKEAPPQARASKWGWLHAPMGLHVGKVDARFEALLEGRRPVLNVGAKHTGGAGWINLDITRHAASINLLGDARRLPLANGTLSGVVMKFVLEHVPDPVAVVAEVHRVLRPGGLFFATVPFVEPFHPDPGDYQRYTVDGLKRLCQNFTVLESGVYYGPASAVAEVLREFAAVFFDQPVLKKLVRLAAGWLFWPVKFLDVILARKRNSFILAYGIYIVAQKRAEP